MRVYSYKKKLPGRSKSPKKHSFSIGDLLYTLLLLLFSASMLLAYSASFINPEKIFIPLYFGLYFIPIFIFNLLLLIVGISKRRKGAFLSVIILLPTLLFADNFFKFGNEEKIFEGEPVKLLTYNIGRFSLSSNGESEAITMDRVLNYIAQQDADIVCLQEFRIIDTSNIPSLLQQYRFSHFSGYKENGYHFGNLTLSKFPITQSDEIKFSGSSNLCLYDDIQSPHGLIRIYNCHLESYSISFSSIIKRMSRKTISDEFIQLHGKLKSGTIKRVEEVETLTGSINNCEMQSIICGDFNDPPTSYTYHTLLKNHSDSFIESGTGFSGTYSMLWPLLKIDYILLPENFSCTRHNIDRLKYSDHYPVHTVIYLKNSEHND